jgi:hypothetical protein
MRRPLTAARAVETAIFVFDTSAVSADGRAPSATIAAKGRADTAREACHHEPEGPTSTFVRKYFRRTENYLTNYHLILLILLVKPTM